jgi:hypothetical protein
MADLVARMFLYTLIPSIKDVNDGILVNKAVRQLGNR